MPDDRTVLLDLNNQTFWAEERRDIGSLTWREFLQRTLAPTFLIRRSRPDLPDQNRAEMLEWIEQHPPVARTIRNDDVAIWCDNVLGVVVSSIEMHPDGVPHRYRNIKVFDRRSETWQCVYWQVTEAPVAH
jgi:hypothetical protein